MDKALIISMLTAADLAEIVEMEQRSSAYPWAMTHYQDSLQAQYPGWQLRIGAAIAAEQQASKIIGVLQTMVVVDELHILNVVVDRQYQRQGLGVKLMQHAQRYAKENHLTSILLEVRASNTAAIGLYQTAGFEIIGRRRGYYPAMSGREDALVMRGML